MSFLKKLDRYGGALRRHCSVQAGAGREPCASRWWSSRSASASSTPPTRAPRKPPRNSATSRSSTPARPTTTAEAQIEVINSLIAQKVDAIAVSANDADALVPVAEEGDGARHQGDLVGFGRRAGGPPDAPQPLVDRADRQHDHQAGRRRPAGRRRRRDPLGRRDHDQPERLDRGDEEGAGRTIPDQRWSPPSMATTWPTSATARRRA